MCFHVDGVMCAVVALALPLSLEPLRVAASSVTEAPKGGGADAWGASELLTFRCGSDGSWQGHIALTPTLHPVASTQSVPHLSQPQQTWA